MNRRVVTICMRLFIVSLFSLSTLQSQQKQPSAEQMLSVNGSLGTEFWITIPPNEIASHPTSSLELFIASAFDTEIEVFDSFSKQTRKYQVQAYQVRDLTNAGKSETSWTWEVREFEQVITKAIRITSKRPISVYVYNGKFESSDGYLAIPTNTWGKEYIATAYYDYKEYRPWAGGFVIIAKEDGTEVSINLKGTTDGAAKTSGGKQLNTGQPFTITMNQGDIYALIGDGTTRGVFDMTGSHVKATKPIGMISYHMRSTVPSLLVASRGRNHLVEMTPPVSTWGKKYVTVEYNRSGTNPIGKGDSFRVIASQDNTVWKMDYYDKITKVRLGGRGTPLAKAGDFVDVDMASAPTTLPYGFSVWKANKPIFVMQYSNSWRFDDDIRHDPFMINVVPEEQFIPNTIFQTPNDSKFSSHNLNLIVKADTLDPNYIENLKSLEIDGVPVWNHPKMVGSTLLANNMGDNLHWFTIAFASESRAHVIKGNGKVTFGGYIYGFGVVDAYGWPAASGFRPTGIVDTMPPVLTKKTLCGDFDYTATEFRNIPDPPRTEPIDTDQVETGVAVIDTVSGSNSFNYRLVLITDQQLSRYPPYYKFEFRWEVIDKTKDAYAEFFVQDWADNITYDTVRYFAEKLAFSPSPLDFGKLRLNSLKDLPLTITNRSGGPVVLTSSTIRISSVFSIVNNAIISPVTLNPDESYVMTLRYNGTRETTDLLTDFDVDTVDIQLTCTVYTIPLKGIAAIPRIVVEDFRAGTVPIGVERCKPGGLKIRNDGSDTLVVTNLVGYGGSNFTVSVPTKPPMPFRIPPKGGEVYLEKVCFERSDVGADSIDVVFQNNGEGPDSVSTWTGNTEAPGPGIEGYNWLKRRVNTRHQAFARVYNTGNQTLTLTDVTFEDGTKYFPPGSTETNFIFKIGIMLQFGSPVTSVNLINGGSVDVLVEFRPAAATTYKAKIIPVWSTPNVPPREAFLEGEGIVPQLATEGASLTCSESPDNTPAVRDLVLTNNGSMVLTITRLVFATGSDPSWNWVNQQPSTPFIIQFTAGNNEIRIPVQYTRPTGYLGGSALTIEIDHDATPGLGIDSNSYTPVTSTQSFFVGSCAGPDIEVTDIDFGPLRANCDERFLEFTITNTGGGSRLLEIRDLVLTDADAYAFEVVSITGPGGTPVLLPFGIPAGQSAMVLVRFTPTEPNIAPWTDRVYRARIRVMNYDEGASSELKPNTYAEVQGKGFVIPVSMQISNNTGGAIKKAGDEVQFSVSAQSPNWQDAELTAFTADIYYQTLALQYFDGTINLGAALSGWNVADAILIPVDGTRSIMRFEANGPNPISADGLLFTFESMLLLGPDFGTEQSLEVDLKKPCLVPSTQGTSTGIVNCALTKRVVSLGNTRYSMSPISPNPVYNGSVEIDFSIGIKAPVKIDLFGPYGTFTKSLVDSELDSGEYSLTFQSNDFPSGSYYIQLKTVDFNKTQKFVIVK